jgi:ABC-type transporter Mla maintaining outer membrane lipid asymmetry ATPase subunit MlaF
MDSPEPTPLPPAPSSGRAIEMIGVAVAALHEPGRVALEEINWSVTSGEFWAVAGLLGAGKTDLLALTAGVMRPIRGTYRLFGKEFTDRYEHEMLEERLRVGMVFDGGQLLSRLTLAENIALPLQYHRDYSREACAEFVEPLLEFTGTVALAGLYPGQVSRIWLQRVGLARALALRPEVVLLDNPLSGLDPRQATWWMENLVALSRGHPITGGRPLTLVVTGHDLRTWKGMANRFGILKNRRLITVTHLTDPSAHAESLHEELLKLESESPGTA